MILRSILLCSFILHSAHLFLSDNAKSVQLFVPPSQQKSSAEQLKEMGMEVPTISLMPKKTAEVTKKSDTKTADTKKEKKKKPTYRDTILQKFRDAFPEDLDEEEEDEE